MSDNAKVVGLFGHRPINSDTLTPMSDEELCGKTYYFSKILKVTVALRAPIPGVEFEEMLYPCQCCGAGGGIKSGKPDIAMELSRSKAEMIKDTGAEAVVTICPFCKRNLQDGLDDIGCEDIKTMHLLELLDKAYE